MSDYSVTIIEKPPWFRIAPLKNGWGKRPPFVIGYDSEAYKGEPFLLQFSRPGESWAECTVIPTTGRKCLIDFIEAIEEDALAFGRSHRVIVVGWNLRYEYTQLFRNENPEIWDQGSFTLHLHREGAAACTQDDNDDWAVRIDALNEKRFTFTIHFSGHNDNRPGRKRRDRYAVKVIDGMAYFLTGLNKAAGIVGIEGKDIIPEADKGTVKPAAYLKRDDLMKYAKRDAWITRRLGETIVGYHQKYDVSMTVSAPMLAAHVFRRRYLDGEIPLCADEVEHAGLRSYHGGKNGYYLPGPRRFEDAYDYDINAAYTSAMATLPDPVNSVWEEIHRYVPGVNAMWYVIADVKSCIYRAFQNDSGRWYTWQDDGQLGFWITSYELDVALALGEVQTIFECSGFIMNGDEGVGSLRRYCDEMSALKVNATTAEERTFAKLMLNSLYGKFIQKVPNDYTSITPIIDWYEDEQGFTVFGNANMVEGGYRAGGLYHPGIASLITGKVRARVHQLEHKYQSLMTSTDGFLSLIPPDPDDIGLHVGGMKVKRGSLSVWRERLYLFEPPGDDPVYALHGFRGKLADLRQLPIEPSKFDYRARQMIGLRESRMLHDKKRYRPGQFADLPYVLDLRLPNDRAPLPPGTIA